MGANQQPAQKQNFGRVIKTRFFKLMPDGTKSQIQDKDTLTFLCGRLCYHLRHPEGKNEKPFNWIPQALTKWDSDFKTLNNLRRIFNYNKSYDHCMYLITGRDAVDIENVARNFQGNGNDRKAMVIEKHWQKIRNNALRLQDDNQNELSLNIILRPFLNSKTQEENYSIKEMNLVQEKYMQFPYRRRGENLP